MPTIVVFIIVHTTGKQTDSSLDMVKIRFGEAADLILFSGYKKNVIIYAISVHTASYIP